MEEILDLEERIKLAIKIGESHYREFKSAWGGPVSQKVLRPAKDLMFDISKSLVAFANADGGELLLGVEDEGTITGAPYSAEELSQILAATQTHIHPDTPLPAPRKTHLDVDGKKVIYFYVPKGTQYIHLTSDGRCLKRVDRESIPFSAEKIVANRLEDQSRTWDREIAFGATLEHLDLDLIRSVASQVAYGISVEKCLQYLDLAEFTPDGLKLKKAAAVLFAKDIRKWHPGCIVRILTIRGKEKRTGEGFNIVKDEVVSDNVLKLVDSSWERLTHALSVHTQLTESARFQQHLMYPQIAVREALMNAIVHRNYAIEGRGIEISIYQDRLEILSPGMLLSTVSIDDIRTLKGAHESRNPLIARVLREVGLIQELGEGIRRIFNVMRSNALAEPDIESNTTGFTVTLFHKSLYDPNVKLWLTNFDSFKLTENQLAVMALGYGGKEFSTQDIIDRLGIVNIDQIREILTPLRYKGLIERTKNDAQTIQYSRRMHLPRREVPRFRVVNRQEEISTLSKRAHVDDDSGVEERSLKMFLANLSYNTTKAELVTFLRQYCDVLDLYVPSGTEYDQPNKGYAFANVIYDGLSSELVRRIDGQMLAGRPIHVHLDRQR